MPLKKWNQYLLSILKGCTIGVISLASFVAVVYFHPFQPAESFKQLFRHNNVHLLVDPYFNGVETINKEIDQLLNTQYHYNTVKHNLTPEQRITIQAVAVDRWVSSNIKYISDLENWRFPNHFSTPEEVIKRGQDDCDGIAILTTSILLHRNIPARLAINGNHAWSELVTKASIKNNNNNIALTISVPAENVIKQTNDIAVYPGYSKPENRELLHPIIEKALNFMQALPYERVGLWTFLYTGALITIFRKESHLKTLSKASIISVIVTIAIIFTQKI